MEDWKDIAGFEGLYQVSNRGRVRSLSRTVSFGSQQRTTPSIILKPGSLKGYQTVNLCADNKPRGYLVHRLVAVAFIPNPDNLPDVDHIDFDRGNNRAENLQWATRFDNLDRSRTAGRMTKGEDSHHATITEADVRRIRALSGTLPRATIANMYGLSANHIYRIVARKKWKHVA